MRFSEVFLRLGLGLVAWILLLTYFLWLGVTGRVGCGPEGVEIYLVLLGLAPVALGGAVLLGATRPLGDVHTILRWGVVLIGLLTPFALLSTWKVFSVVWTAGQGICGPDAPLLWEKLWPVVHLATVAIVLFLLYRNWKGAADGEGA